ncbi:hypothetical protein Cni_G02182 [Canna indica]|uniref:peptidylprolyl isomerase n=1 Tax=Canna indica TaxID=4628 RepID=A0AAQ3JNS0_9LILI|nr:hypothetical protein Cni_G02182 [Canna indica]
MAAEQRASHILIKHKGSRRKASLKDPEGRVISATTRDDAVRQILALRDDFMRTARRLTVLTDSGSDNVGSDCPIFYRRKKAQREMAEAKMQLDRWNF